MSPSSPPSPPPPAPAAHPSARSEPPAAPTGLSSVSSLPSEVWKTSFQGNEKILRVQHLGFRLPSAYPVPKLSGKKGADAFGLLSSALSRPRGRGCLPAVGILCRWCLCAWGRTGSERVGGVGGRGLASAEACVGIGHLCGQIGIVWGCGYRCAWVCSQVSLEVF